MRMLRQFRPERQPQIQPARSKTYAERLGNLGEAFALRRVGITPGRTAFKLIKNLWPGFGVGLGGKLIPQIFDQLEAFKLTQVFDGL